MSSFLSNFEMHLNLKTHIFMFSVCFFTGMKRGVPPPSPDRKGVTQRDNTNDMIKCTLPPWTGYVAGGMPFAVTQQDFPCLKIVVKFFQVSFQTIKIITIK